MIKCLKDTKQPYALLKSILLKHIYPWRVLQFVHHTNTKKKKGATGVKELGSFIQDGWIICNRCKSEELL